MQIKRVRGGVASPEMPVEFEPNQRAGKTRWGGLVRFQERIKVQGTARKRS